MKVIFTGASEAQTSFGGHVDGNKLLEVGKVYEIEKREQHSWHTKLYLVGIEGHFNDVCFDLVPDGEG